MTDKLIDDVTWNQVSEEHLKAEITPRYDGRQPHFDVEVLKKNNGLWRVRLGSVVIASDLFTRTQAMRTATREVETKNRETLERQRRAEIYRKAN